MSCILALATCGARLEVALAIDGRVVSARASDGARGQADALVPLIDATMSAAGFGFAALDLIAVETGPGSFTGLRVGFAAASGIAAAISVPLIGLSSFALAYAALGPVTEPVLVLLESKRAALYACLFDAAGRAEPSFLVEPAALTARFERSPLIVTGDAAPLWSDPPAGITQAAEPASRAVALAEEIIARRALGADLPAAQPFYLRPPDAIPARGAFGAIGAAP